MKINFVKLVSFVVIASIIFFGAITIKKLNSEYNIRKIAGAFQKYKFSTLSFKNVYSQLPGDIEKAVFYMGQETENGNGNGKIEDENKESILAWQHLQLSDTVEFEYQLSGQWIDDSSQNIYPEVNIPGDKKTRKGYIFKYFEEHEKNSIGKVKISKDYEILPSLSPNMAYKLDLMIDDGYPTSGNFISKASESGNCFFAGEYLSDDVNEDCLSYFLF